MAAFNHQSLEWRETSLKKRRHDGYRCQGCGRNCFFERGRLVAHHVLGAKRYPECALDQRYLETVCTRCHDVVEIAIRYPFLAELINIGLHPETVIGKAVRQTFGPVQWQFPLDLEAANDEDFTLDPPIEVSEDSA